MSRYRGGKHCGCLHRPSSISLPVEAPADTGHVSRLYELSAAPPHSPRPQVQGVKPHGTPPPPPEGNWTGWLPPPRTLNKRDQRRANQYSAATGYNDRVGTTATTAAIAAIANAIGIIGIIGNKQVDGEVRGATDGRQKGG